MATNESNPQPENDIDLDPVSTDDLIAELAARCDGMIIAMEQDHGPHSGTLMEWRGSLSLGIGLAERMRARLVAHAIRPDSDDEPNFDAS